MNEAVQSCLMNGIHGRSANATAKDRIMPPASFFKLLPCAFEFISKRPTHTPLSVHTVLAMKLSVE